MQCKYCGDFDTLTFLIIDSKVIYKCSSCKNELNAEDLQENRFEIEELEVDYAEENLFEMWKSC